MTFLFSLSPSSSQSPSRGTSVVPVVVSNILSSMQVHQSPSTLTTNEGRASGLTKNGGDKNRVDHALRRTKSREEKSAVAEPLRLSNRPKTSAGGGSRSASRRFVTSTQVSTPPESVVNQPHRLSPSASRFSYETSSSTSTKRLVGRGGSGSKYRVVAPKSPTLDIGTLSKPDLLSEPRPPPPDVPTFHRPSGRGGIGARKKSVEAPPAVLSKLPLRKVLSTRFRKDSSSSGKSVRSVESIAESSTSPHIPPSQNFYHERNEPFWTHDTTSSGELNHSPCIIPEDEDENELNGYLPPLSPACSTFEDTSGCATPASVRKKGNIAKVAKMLGELPPHDIYENLYRQQHLMQEALLHDASPDSKASVKMSRRSSIAAGIYSLFSSARSPGSTASQCTLSTTPDGLHPGIFADDVSDSWGRISIDISTEDADDLDRQPSLRSKTPESPMMFSPPSPSLVPTRKAENEAETSDAEKTTAGSTNQPISPTPKPTPILEIDTMTLERVNSHSSSSSSPTTPVPALLRSRSHSLAARRNFFRTSRSASLSFGLDSVNGNGKPIVTEHGHDRQLDEGPASPRFPSPADSHKRQSQMLPELAHWLKAPNASAEPHEEKDVFSAYRIDAPAKSQAWSGEWNTEMQDVIRALRLLR